MNLYVIDAGLQTYTEVIDPELGGPQFECRWIDQVAAETPGLARSLYSEWLRDNYGIRIKWTDPCWHIYTVARNIRKYKVSGVYDDPRYWRMFWRAHKAVQP